MVKHSSQLAEEDEGEEEEEEERESETVSPNTQNLEPGFSNMHTPYPKVSDDLRESTDRLRIRTLVHDQVRLAREAVQRANDRFADCVERAKFASEAKKTLGSKVMALTEEVRVRQRTLEEAGGDLEALLTGPTVSAAHAIEVAGVREAAVRLAAEHSDRGVKRYNSVTMRKVGSLGRWVAGSVGLPEYTPSWRLQSSKGDEDEVEWEKLEA